jgi:hypothetical protein
MNDRTLRKLQRHAQAAANILDASVLEAALDALDDHANGIDVTARALNILAAITDAATLRRIAGEVRTAREVTS